MPWYSIPYYGSFCGPGWSDGKRQDSVIGRPPTDEFDALCWLHDAIYATATRPQSLSEADLKFYKSVLANPRLAHSFKPRFAAEILRLQSLLRNTMTNAYAYISEPLKDEEENDDATNLWDWVPTQSVRETRKKNLRGEGRLVKRGDETAVAEEVVKFKPPPPVQPKLPSHHNTPLITVKPNLRSGSQPKPKPTPETTTTKATAKITAAPKPTSGNTKIAGSGTTASDPSPPQAPTPVDRESAPILVELGRDGTCSTVPTVTEITAAPTPVVTAANGEIESGPPQKYLPSSYSMVRKNTRTTKRRNRPSQPALKTTAPVAVGTTIAGGKRLTQNGRDSTRIKGHDLLGTIYGPTSSSNPELGFKWSINPCYLSSGSLSMYNPFYDEYRFNSIKMTFFTKVPTSTNGEVFMSVTDNPTTNLFDITSGAFYSKFMTSQNAVMCPIWQSTSIVWTPSERTFKKVNPLTDGSPSESTYGDALVYVQSNTGNVAVGYLLLEYDIVYRKKRFSSQTAMLSSLSPTVQLSFSETATHAVNGDVTVSSADATYAAAAGNLYGSVWEATYDSNTTFPSAWYSSILGDTKVLQSIKPGAKLYFVAKGQSSGYYSFVVYTNYPSAIACGRDNLVYNDTNTAFTGLVFQITAVYAGIAQMLTAV